MRSPGIYLLLGSDARDDELSAVEGFRIGAHGELAALRIEDDFAVAFDGILLSRTRHPTDTDAVLEAFRRGGPSAVAELDGFFRVVIVERASRRAHLITDRLATRPVFVYRRGTMVALAPTPTYFAERGLPCFIDRLGLYQMCRVCHPIGEHSLLREVHRARPRCRYTIESDGTVTRTTPPTVHQDPDPAIDLDGASDLIYENQRAVMRGILEHPLLAERELSLPLTSGMDSRHILGMLLEANARPARVRHVRVYESEYRPVAQIASALGMSLEAPRVAELPLADLTRRWLLETGGLVHFHQLYLLGAAPASGPRALSLDGYLADFFFSGFILPQSLRTRKYSATALRLLFSDHADLEAECLDVVGVESSRWQGSDDFVARGIDCMNRGPSYTGALFPVFANCDSFAPAAHPSALELFRRIPEAVAAGKRARVNLFRRHYAELARFSDQYGSDLMRRDTLVAPRAQLASEALHFALGMIPGLGRDPAPETPHEWLRTIPFYRSLFERLATESALARDNHFSPHRLRALWAYEKRGGFVGWMLMGILSAEVAYRLFVDGQSIDEVREFLGAK